MTTASALPSPHGGWATAAGCSNGAMAAVVAGMKATRQQHGNITINIRNCFTLLWLGVGWRMLVVAAAVSSGNKGLQGIHCNAKQEGMEKIQGNTTINLKRCKC